MRTSPVLPALFLLTLVGVVGCGGEDASGGGNMDASAFGPVDGRDLPPTDLERVQDGDLAPDFTLPSLDGPPVTLSDARGEQNVVLVFYRGHW